MNPRVTAHLCAVLFGIACWFCPGSAEALECPPLPQGGQAPDGEIRHAQGIVWQVVAPNGARSVILGTMHLADERIAPIVAVAEAELAASDSFVMEVVLDGDAMAELQLAMFYSDGRNLRELAGDELFTHAAQTMQRYGVPAELVEAMKPWAVFTTLGTPPGAAGLPMDMLLMQQAQAAGKTVIGLETVGEQVAVFESVAESLQLEMLRETTCYYDLLQDEVAALVDIYSRRDLRALVELSFRHIDRTRETFLDALLWQRNTLMLERMAATLAQGRAFIAVGALHLPGNRGILQGLEQRGFKVEAIY